MKKKLQEEDGSVSVEKDQRLETEEVEVPVQVKEGKGKKKKNLQLQNKNETGTTGKVPQAYKPKEDAKQEQHQKLQGMGAH